MRATNKAIRDYLVKLGFYDIVNFPHTRFFKDVWHLWDGVAKKGGSIYWVQNKTGYASKEDKERLKEFCEKFNQRGLVVERIKIKQKYTGKPTKAGYDRYAIKITELP